MITIDQLLESVVLDFEPRFVTKDEDGIVSIWEKKPERCDNFYRVDSDNDGETIDVERLVAERYSTVYRGIRFYFDNGDQLKAFCKIVESKVDAVNEFKGAKNE